MEVYQNKTVNRIRKNEVKQRQEKGYYKLRARKQYCKKNKKGWIKTEP